VYIEQGTMSAAGLARMQKLTGKLAKERLN
jgi:hypothetical protein